ncbi:hypothetical protein Tco_1394088 [Tanacetum coccineum]
MTNPILNEARANQYLATESNVKFKLSKELLTELQSNTYSGLVEEDVIGHIAKVLEILDLVKISSLDPFQLRIKTFPLSLSGDVRKWWMNEGDGKITTREELVKKIFRKFYPISCANNYDKMCDDNDEGRDLLEFIPWMNSKFKDYKKVDETTKRALLYTWIEVGNKEGLMDKLSSDEEWEEHEYGTLPNPASKPNLDTHYKGDGSNHEKRNENENELGKFPYPNNASDKGRMDSLAYLKLSLRSCIYSVWKRVIRRIECSQYVIDGVSLGGELLTFTRGRRQTRQLRHEYMAVSTE